MKKIIIVISLIMIVSGFASAQQNSYVVIFKDKAATTFSLDNPGVFLSQQAIDRRIDQGLSLDSLDLPVVESYIQQVRNLGVDVYLSTKWMNGVVIQALPENISAIENLSIVKEVIYVAPTTKLSYQGRVEEAEDAQSNAQTETTDTQLDMLGINTLHAQGFKGRDINIAFLDGGFAGVNTTEAFSHLYNNGKLLMAFDLIENDVDVYHATSHGTNVLATVSALLDGEYQGAAPEANIFLFRTEDPQFVDEYRIEEYNWLIAAEKADSAGVDIISSSVGYFDFEDPTMNYTYDQMDGQTTVITRAADIAFDKGMLVITSAGNQGDRSWRYITAPADAHNIISVGSVDTDLTKSSFSSVGPTSDGRIKPEVMALGRNTSVVSLSGIVSTNSGTSFSAPLIAGLSALLWEKNPQLTNVELRNLILDMGDRSANPDNEYGYGVPRYESILSLDKELNQSVKIHPNPLTGNVLTIRTGVYGKELSIDIYDVNGKHIKSERLISDQHTKVDLSSINPGFYIIQITGAGANFKSKLIKR